MDKELIKRLIDETDANFENRNTFTEEQFRKYLPLFDPNIKSANLNALSHEFYRAVDFYRPIKIIDGKTQEVLITIPPRLIQPGVGSQDKLTSSVLQSAPAHRPDIEAQAMNKYSEGLATLFKSSDYVERVREAIALHERFKTTKSVSTSVPEKPAPDNPDDLWGDE